MKPAKVFILKRFFIFSTLYLIVYVIVLLDSCLIPRGSHCEGEVAFFSAKHWNRRNKPYLIESATPCHDDQVVGSIGYGTHSS